MRVGDTHSALSCPKSLMGIAVEPNGDRADAPTPRSARRLIAAQIHHSGASSIAAAHEAVVFPEFPLVSDQDAVDGFDSVHDVRVRFVPHDPTGVACRSPFSSMRRSWRQWLSWPAPEPHARLEPRPIRASSSCGLTPSGRRGRRPGPISSCTGRRWRIRACRVDGGSAAVDGVRLPPQRPH